MVANPMFYQKIVTLNRESHKDLKVDLGQVRYGFARSAHLIPAVLDEFFVGARSLPIVFLPGPGRATPVFLVGFEPGKNLFVGSDGQWKSDYIPAFIRRYPFIIGEVEGAQPLVCFDETSSSLSRDGGEPLFTEDGQDAPHLREIVKFTGEYMAAANRTNDFVDTLQKLDLFNAITIAVRLPDSSNKTLHGAMSIDVAKFDGLKNEVFLELRKKGFLQPIFSQISSVGLIEKLVALDTDSKSDTEPKRRPVADDFEDARPETAELLN